MHADHVWPITERRLQEITTVEEWLAELRQVATVVCVTARENYQLVHIEKQTQGPEKYALAGVAFTSTDLPWTRATDVREAERQFATAADGLFPRSALVAASATRRSKNRPPECGLASSPWESC